MSKCNGREDNHELLMRQYAGLMVFECFEGDGARVVIILQTRYGCGRGHSIGTFVDRC